MKHIHVLGLFAIGKKLSREKDTISVSSCQMKNILLPLLPSPPDNVECLRQYKFKLFSLDAQRQVEINDITQGA